MSQILAGSRCSQLTADGDLSALAGGDAVDVGQHPHSFPGLQQELQDVAGVQLLLRQQAC